MRPGDIPATVFAIDACAYAVMSNHLHLVLRLMSERARKLSQKQVVDRYYQVFPGGKEQLESLQEAERPQFRQTLDAGPIM